MYGSEVWVLNMQQEPAIHATEKKVLRRISEKRMVDRVRSVEIRNELKQEGVLENVKRSQVRCRKALEDMGTGKVLRDIER